VLRIVDGPIAPLPCLSKIAYRRCDDCISESACEIRKVFSVVADSTRDILDNSTLADAIAAEVKRSPKAKSATPRKVVS
jgi:DNA-binding IscR family transcriptional regulator